MEVDGESAAAAPGTTLPATSDIDVNRVIKKDGCYCGFVSGPLLAKKEALASLLERLSSEPRIAHLVLAGNTVFSGGFEYSKAENETLVDEYVQRSPGDIRRRKSTFF